MSPRYVTAICHYDMSLRNTFGTLLPRQYRWKCQSNRTKKKARFGQGREVVPFFGKSRRLRSKIELLRKP